MSRAVRMEVERESETTRNEEVSRQQERNQRDTFFSRPGLCFKTNCICYRPGLIGKEGKDTKSDTLPISLKPRKDGTFDHQPGLSSGYKRFPLPFH